MSRVATLMVLLLALSLGSGVPRPASGGKRDEDEHHHGRSDVRRLLTFRTMFGVDGAFVGDAHPIGDIAGDELPWEIDFALGRLDTDGKLFLRVEGLVFKDDPSVPEELRGINDEEEFRAAVTCLTEEDGDVVSRTMVTEGFPATEDGDALIRARLELPDPCIAPAVLVLAGSEDKWFAVTGFETEEEE